MWKIRKPKRESQSASNHEPDPRVPRSLVRLLLFNLRFLHKNLDGMSRCYEAMPLEWRVQYKSWTEIELRPNFEEVLSLIERARTEGHLTEDEAANLRAGQRINLEFPQGDRG